ncbi:fused N-dimethylarginine dimethylaminohydrolase/saccharopine dehydrogenase domain-containing protein [Anaerococcus lactolyticus]|uniref:LOR/SDH bifunctional protein n=1 Tax=Anaerococcus lactolyticus S7-1-13 TaxID=1284686 RepID=A0A095X0U8_9FIRM|nr:fused N-dimethylarginine dimethylaminohydrolase/saccharopine dehydrogenase domain-containing protein [Anaerococcus lactolyticus]KGF03685.1 LOR/SDH bifunctional protein [Anaerococcus lactolyticus S7-1-13]
MKFEMPKYHHPDFEKDFLKNAPNVTLEEVKVDGLSPRNYHALSVYPEYFKINDKWVLAAQSRMDTVCVANDTPGEESVNIVEFRNLKKGDKVVIGRTEDASEGIYVWTQGFLEGDAHQDTFAFRAGRSRETAFSIDYDNLYEVLKYEKAHKGYVTLIVGAALALDRDSRAALERLVRNGYVNAIFCGTETAAFDLEKGIFGTTWGQEKFEKEQNSTKNLYKTINLARKYGSTKALVESGKVKDGFMKACVEMNVPVVIAGTIRDRLGLPETINNVYDAQNEMRKHARKTSTIIMMGAILYTIATGNMTPSYNVFDGVVRPVYMYTIDIQEFAVNKLSDRGTVTAVSMVTNVQDFIRNVDRALNN